MPCSKWLVASTFYDEEESSCLHRLEHVKQRFHFISTIFIIMFHARTFIYILIVETFLKLWRAYSQLNSFCDHSGLRLEVCVSVLCGGLYINFVWTRAPDLVTNFFPWERKPGV